MKINFENKTIWYYLELAALVLTLVGTALYGIMGGGDGVLKIEILALLIVALAASIVKVFFKNTFVDIIPAIALGVALGLLLLDGLPIISDIWNNVNFITSTMRGLPEAPAYYAGRYYIYIALTAIAMVLNAVAVFFDTEKA